jgi:hypothetical protein
MPKRSELKNGNPEITSEDEDPLDDITKTSFDFSKQPCFKHRSIKELSSFAV